MYVLVGNRDLSHLRTSIRTVRRYDIPITVYSDIELDIDADVVRFQRVKHPVREENRNSSLIRLIALRDSPHDCTCYLDNDVYVVDSAFLEGFAIAERFGVAMPINPRLTIKKELDKGVDVLPCHKELLKAIPGNLTAFNAGLFYAHKIASPFLKRAVEIQSANSGRGQANLIQTVWETGTAPYILPKNWLVCSEDCGTDNPITLHAGHRLILEWYKKDFAQVKLWT